MSRAIPKMKLAEILDPVTAIDTERIYGILRGGSVVQEKSYETTDFSNTQMGFTVNPNSLNTIIDRNIKVKVPITIDFTGSVSGSFVNLLNTGFDAFRANPIASITENLEAKINGTTTSIRLSDLKDPLLRFNTGYDIRNRDYSTSPSMQDQYQRYADQGGTLRNPLAGYGDGYEIPRGAFNYDVVSNTPTTAQIQATLVEPLFLSPFVFGHKSKSGLYNVSQLSFTFSFVSNLSKIWSHSLNDGVNFSTLSTITVTIGKPAMLVKQVSPRTDQKIPRSLVYPYYEVVGHPSKSSISYAPNATGVETGLALQLNSVPRRMYIFCRENKQVRNGPLGYLKSDTYMGIDGLTVEYGTKNLLSSATRQDLYKMSVKNGLSMSWEQFSGRPTYQLGDNNTGYGTIGSIVCVEFGTDIGLGSLAAPSLLDKQQLQITATVRNVNQTDTIVNPELWVVIVYEGIFTIQSEMTSKQIGILNSNDILNASFKPQIDYFDIQDAYGGNFFSGLKSIGRKFIKSAKGVAKHIPGIIKHAPEFAQRAIDTGEKVAPIALKIAQFAPLLLPLLGLGLDEDQLEMAFAKHMRNRPKARKSHKRGKAGGVLVGGKKLTNKQLLARLMN